MAITKQQVKQRLERIATRYARDAIIAHEISHRLLARLDYMTLQAEHILVLQLLPGELETDLALRFPDAHINCVNFSGDDSLACPDQSIDLLVMNLTWLYYQDPSRLLVEMARVLKPEGLILFSSLGPDTLVELKTAWLSIDDSEHVAQFEDMHHVGDRLMHQFFIDPVMEMEYLRYEYDDLKTLALDLRYSAMNFPGQHAQKGLLTPDKWQQLEKNYRGSKQSIIASFEVIYGHAWRSALPCGVQSAVDGVVEIPLDIVRQQL